ncbi:MAG: sulfatase-like hydrolase/transferase [Planctomycetes bacterium]|jgi:choline-sulfatase|nr:sulfatase-like hydrolase/transferase [Planctomycetota bacterium]
MKRREFLTTTMKTAAGLALTQVPASGANRPGRPNILFIMTDQQHAGMMSCTGNKWLKTPALDRLAAAGLRFERAYACNPVCVPSRFSLQTGLMPSAIGMRTNEDAKQSLVTDTMMQQSLGNLFQKAGYETVYGGKVHLPARMNNLKAIGYRNLTGNSRQELAQACAQFLKGPHTQPFLLFASFINPHDICYMAINAQRRANGQPPMDNVDSKTCEGVLENPRKSANVAAFVRDHCPPLPANHGIPDLEPECIPLRYAGARSFRAYVRANWDEEQWRLHRWAYCRLTEMVDAEIGTVLDALREAGLQDNTLVVFTSDHGDMDSAHKLEHKSVLYEESVHIPFIMSLPGVIPQGTVDRTHFVSNGLDLLPTLCDFAGIETPAGLPGRSLRPLAEGKAVQDWRDFVVSESQNGRMLRTDRFKYCLYDSGERREQLTDLQDDPGEMKNLAEVPACKTNLDQHRRRLRDWVQKIDDRIAATYLGGV